MRLYYIEVYTLIADLFYQGNPFNDYQVFCVEVATFIILALAVILPFYLVIKFIKRFL